MFALGAGGCCHNSCQSPRDNTVDPTLATATAIAQAEQSRVGQLARLHGRGVAEFRTKDEKGEHFDQGDIDLRWNPALGMAASVSKLGDRWSWIGSNTTHWWVFELKSDPTLLRTGSLNSPAAGVTAAIPWMLGLRPLIPSEGSTPRLIKETLRVVVATPDGTLPEGATLEAEFDPKSLAPVLVTLSARDGSVWRSGLKDWLTVETPGVAQGAWARIPRRVQIVGGRDDHSTLLLIALSSARADPEATDRPGLYDLAALRERFAPQNVETQE